MSLQQLTPNATFLVRGKVGFSRITRHTTDEEREKENRRRTYKQATNYSNITIYQATVLLKGSSPTPEEQYAAETLYQSASQNYPGYNFSAMNKSQNLPSVGLLVGPNQYNEVKLEGELANGLDVTLVCRIFESKTFHKNGVTLERVLINEPIRYYKNQNNNLSDQLNDYGITFTAAPPSNETTPDGIPTAAAEAAACEPKDYAEQTTTPANAFAAARQPQATAPANTFTAAGQPQATEPANAFTAAGQPQATAPAMTEGNPFSSYQQTQNANTDNGQPMTFTPGQRQY